MYSAAPAPRAPGTAPKRKSVQYPPPSPSGRASRSGSEAGDDIAPFSPPEDATPDNNNNDTTAKTAAPTSTSTTTTTAPPPPSSPSPYFAPLSSPPPSNNTAPPQAGRGEPSVIASQAPPQPTEPARRESTSSSSRPQGNSNYPESSPSPLHTAPSPPKPSGPSGVSVPTRVAPTTTKQASSSSNTPVATTPVSRSLDPRAGSEGVPLGGPGGPRRVTTVRPAMSAVTGSDRFAVIPKLQGGADRLKDRVSSSLHNLLLDRCPERIDRHDEILDQYAGKERELLEFMMTVFGDEILAGPRPDLSIITSAENSFMSHNEPSSPHKPRSTPNGNTTAMLDEAVETPMASPSASMYQSQQQQQQQLHAAPSSLHLQNGAMSSSYLYGAETLSRFNSGRTSVHFSMGAAGGGGGGGSNMGEGRTRLITPPVPKDLIPSTPTSTSRQGGY